MSRFAWKWVPIGLGLLTVVVFTGCQTAGSRSLGIKNPDTAIEQSVQETDLKEQSYRLASASRTTAETGTSIQDMPGPQTQSPARRSFFRSSSYSS